MAVQGLGHRGQQAAQLALGGLGLQRVGQRLQVLRPQPGAAQGLEGQVPLAPLPKAAGQLPAQARVGVGGQRLLQQPGQGEGTALPVEVAPVVQVGHLGLGSFRELRDDQGEAGEALEGGEVGRGDQPPQVGLHQGVAGQVLGRGLLELPAQPQPFRPAAGGLEARAPELGARLRELLLPLLEGPGELGLAQEQGVFQGPPAR